MLLLKLVAIDRLFKQVDYQFNNRYARIKHVKSLIISFVDSVSGHVWLEGDNKEMSLDSRDYGPVPKGLITGKVFFTFWPLSRTGFITLPLRPTSLVETLKAEADQDPWADDVDDDIDDADHSAHNSADSAEKA